MSQRIKQVKEITQSVVRAVYADIWLQAKISHLVDQGYHEVAPGVWRHPCVAETEVRLG